MNLFYSEFLKISIDLDEVSDVIAQASGCHFRLTRLDIKCTYPVFRGEIDGVPKAFVKVGTREEWSHTSKVLKAVGDCALFAKFLVQERIDFHGYVIFVMEWRETAMIRPEDMSDAQVDSFVENCVRMSRALQNVTDVAGVAESPVCPERLYAVVAQYAVRHPIAALLLGDLLKIPVGQRIFGNRQLMTVHGDFHSKNFGFHEDGRMHVCDFDKMMRGIACGDLANALVERFSCLGISARALRRLKKVAGRAIAMSPWPCEDFVVMGNVLRLQFAARRILKHPDSAWVALDILRRDRRIRQFLQCVRPPCAGEL